MRRPGRMFVPPRQWGCKESLDSLMVAADNRSNGTTSDRPAAAVFED